MALISVLFYTVYNHPLPFCLIHSNGLTIVDRLFLFIATIFFSISSVLILKNNNIGNLIFRRLYAYGLGLIAVGFFGISIQNILGDPINRVGCITLYLGAIYMLMALVSSIRSEGKWMLPWEQDIYETGTQYQQMVETVNEGIMMANTYGIVTFVNNKMVEMLGYSKDELLGTDALFLLEKNQHNIMNKKVENREKGLSESYELKFIRKDGKELWTLVSASPIYDSKGVHTNNLAMYMDITERKAIEEKLLFQADIL
ncbi:MAG: PAS domain S-box protein [Methanobacterium sp.]|nr:PAS domain S-box protein [Methanobacterium sp.]